MGSFELFFMPLWEASRLRYFKLFSICATVCIREAYIFQRYSLLIIKTGLRIVIKQTMAKDAAFQPSHILEKINEMSCPMSVLM